ncbi:MAG: nicotinate-nucleotide adenylyltransferase [Maricaulaceae bacterium]|nr:nicotinate-nucleotide adenylyltransferase [Maricaulaceae bacterium]
MAVGLFGGSFDPVHAGHLHVARLAMRRLGLHRFWWLVSPRNPLKTRAPGDYARRLNAVAALAAAPRMMVSDVEARLGAGRSIDVVLALKRRWPRVRFVWVIGADNLKTFHRWARWREIFTALPVAVIARPPDALRARLSPAARMFARTRIPQERAAALTIMQPPVWTYLTGPLHGESSTALRGGINA